MVSPAPASASISVQALKARIARDHGVDCDQFKEHFFLRRLAARVRQTEQPSLRHYITLLDRDAEGRWDVAVVDLSLGSRSGLDMCET